MVQSENVMDQIKEEGEQGEVAALEVECALPKAQRSHVQDEWHQQLVVGVIALGYALGV